MIRTCVTPSCEVTSNAETTAWCGAFLSPANTMASDLFVASFAARLFFNLSGEALPIEHH